MTALMLGKTPATRTPKLLRFRDFLDRTALPPLPAGDYGHDTLVSQWGMLGNDLWGDCVWAGAGHETLLWNAEAGTPVNIDTAAALKNYSAVTHFNPHAGPSGDNPTDQGTDMEAAAKYRRTTGFVDADGKRHKIGVYVDLDPGNLTELWYAAWIFDGVGIGVNFPAQWMDAFNKGAGGLWDAVRKPKIEGGHYITGVARTGGRLNIVTWDDDHPRLTARGYGQFNDQTLAYASQEKLVNGKDDNGFDWPGLLAAQQAITAA